MKVFKVYYDFCKQITFLKSPPKGNKMRAYLF